MAIFSILDYVLVEVYNSPGVVTIVTLQEAQNPPLSRQIKHPKRRLWWRVM